MEIIKYEKKSNGNYLIYLDDGRKIKLNEDVILKHKLLYKKEIDEFLLDEIISDNNNYDIYNKCVNYIGVRLRSIHEMKEYMEHKNVSPELIDETIDRLIKNKLLNDEVFTEAFIKDKMKFTTMGPYRIELELQKHHIDSHIINKYLSQIDEKELETKINKQIVKLMKSKKPNLKNKIYNNLLNLGYASEFILENLNKYNF